MFVHGVFAKSGVRVRIPHHVGHFLSIFGSVYNYRGSTFVCREYDDGVVCFQCLCSHPLPLADVRFREFSSLMVHTTCPLRSSATISVIYFEITSEPAMISSKK